MRLYFLLLGEHSEPAGPSIPLNIPSPAVQQNTALPPSLQGHVSLHSSDVTVWRLNESQSNIGGRVGSNACVFIALYVGKLIMQGDLDWPQGDSMPSTLVNAFKAAMIKGNQIHDDLFDQSPVNVEVEDAVAMAGEECGVQAILGQTDVFGRNPQSQIANLFEKEANYMANGCTVIVADERALLFTVNRDRSAMILDSHNHGNCGAVIAHSKPGDVRSLALWLNGMMQTDWQYTLAIASAHKVMYN